MVNCASLRGTKQSRGSSNAPWIASCFAMTRSLNLINSLYFNVIFLNLMAVDLRPNHFPDMAELTCYNMFTPKSLPPDSAKIELKPLFINKV